MTTNVTVTNLNNFPVKKRTRVLNWLKKRAKEITRLRAIPGPKRRGRLLKFFRGLKRLRRVRFMIALYLALYSRDPFAVAHVFINDKYLKKYCRQPTGPVIETEAHPLMYIAYIFNPLSVAIFPMASPFAAFTGIIQWLFIAAAGEKGFRVDFVLPSNSPHVF